jgi:hypothetical protein
MTVTMRALATGIAGIVTALAAGCRSPASGLDGCLYAFDETANRWSAEQWCREVSFMRQAGFRHVIACGPASGVLSARPAEALGGLDRFMAACRQSDMRVYLSLWAHPVWYARWDLREELDTNARVIDALAERYAAHPNFGGWYIPHEIYVTWDDKTAFMNELYRELSRMCKERTPSGKVLLSPFFILDREGYLGDFRFCEPPEYETFWYDLLAQTDIDVVALQDSGEHLSFHTLEDRRPFFAAMKRACDRAGKTLWANVETGELHTDSYEDYVRRFGAKTHVNAPKTRSAWRAVPAAKLHAKVRFAREFADTTITWGYREYWDPMRGEAAKAVYDAYLGRLIGWYSPAGSAGCGCGTADIRRAGGTAGLSLASARAGPGN